jgi:hypothetical protein
MSAEQVKQAEEWLTEQLKDGATLSIPALKSELCFGKNSVGYLGKRVPEGIGIKTLEKAAKSIGAVVVKGPKGGDQWTLTPPANESRVSELSDKESKSASVAMKLKEGISNVDFQHLECAALTLCEKDKVNSKELGAALIKVRDACAAHGDFTKWMRAHKVDRNRVNYCVRLIEGKVTNAKGRKAAGVSHNGRGSRRMPPLAQWVTSQLVAFDTSGALAINAAEITAQMSPDERRSVARVAKLLVPWLKAMIEASAGRTVQRGNHKKMSQAVKLSRTGETEGDPRQMFLPAMRGQHDDGNR